MHLHPMTIKVHCGLLKKKKGVKYHTVDAERNHRPVEDLTKVLATILLSV